MDILVKELEPGQKYIFQARSRTASGKTSPWSTAFTHTTVSDITAPAPVTGLTWEAVGTSFVGTWDKAEDDSNGKPLKDFKDYKITISSPTDEVVYFVTQERFDFPFERNRSAFAGAEPELDLTVEVRDLVGNLSTPVTETATNQPPGDVTGLVATGVDNGVGLVWSQVTDDDIRYYEVYMSTVSSGFTPGPSNLVYTGLTTSFIFSSTNTIPHYFKVRAVDMFMQGGNYASASATPVASGGVDTTPPDDPTDVEVTTSAGTDGNSSISVTWTAVASTNLSDYIVRYSLDEVAWIYLTVPAGQEEAVITNLLPGTNYYVQVAAMSQVNVKSDFINADIYPITTAADTTAPSQPSAPSVSVSTLAAQVSHDMTKQAGGDLESDVLYLEVHASVTTGFTPSNSTLRGTIDAAAPGVDVSGVFYYPTTDAIANVYWKVIAVDRAKNKSSASPQATGVPGLILNANIGNATITSAKINDLVANKITAGTGIINNLDIKSALTIAAGGSVKSSNYNGTDTGWQLAETGLTIYGGTIAAAALQLQDSNNILPTAVADFQFNDVYYVSSGGALNTTNLSSVGTGVGVSVNSTTAKFGTKSLRLLNGAITNPTVHDLVFAPSGLSTTGLNIDLSPGVYIFSGYFKKNGSVNALVKFGLYTDAAASITSSAVTVNSTSWTRFEAQLTVPSGVSKVKAYLEFGPATSNTGYDFLIDGLQLERKMTGATTAGPWKPPSQTTIDGGQIVTGSIRSSAPSTTDSSLPAWSINTAGNMQVGDAEVRGSLIVGASTPTINLMPDELSGFEKTSSFYTTDSNLANMANLTKTIELTSPPQGSQYIRLVNTTIVGNDDNSQFNTQFWCGSPTTNVITNNIFIKPGQKYIISMWVKNMNPAKEVFMKVACWQDSTHYFTAFADSAMTISVEDITAMTSWTRVSWYYTGKSGVNSGKLTTLFYPQTGTTGFDVAVDGIMIEEWVDEAVTTPSTYVGGYTDDSFVASANYIPGSQGWRIDAQGNSEFNSTLIRGAFEVSSSVGSIEINLENFRPAIKFFGDSSDTFSSIAVVDDVPGEAGLLAYSGVWESEEYPGVDVRHRMFMVGTGFVSNLGLTRLDNGNRIGGNYSWSDESGSLETWLSSGSVASSLITSNTGQLFLKNYVADAYISLNADGTILLDNTAVATVKQIFIANKLAKVDLQPSGYVILQGSTDGSTRNGPSIIAGGSAEGGYMHVFNETWNAFLASTGTTSVSNRFSNGWADSGGNVPVRYKLMSDGTVLMKGRAQSGTNTVGTIVFTLPAGYRPTGTVRFTCAQGSATAGTDPQIAIGSDGICTITRIAGTAAFFYLDCVRFSIV